MAKKKAKLEVKKWHLKGEFSGMEMDSEAILDVAGNALDGACSHDILGQNVFQATNGRYYQVQVNAHIIPLTKDEAKEIIDEVG